MPKTEGQHPHKCPYCSKCFKVVTSLYSHTKSTHGIKYTCHGDAIPVSNIDKKASIEDKIQKLKDKFLRDEISLEQYQDITQMIKEKEEQNLSKIPPVILDFRAIYDKDSEYLINFLRKQLGTEENMINIAECVGRNQHFEVFNVIFANQVRFYTEDDETYMDFMLDGKKNTKLVEEKDLTTMYRGLINAMVRWCHSKLESIMFSTDLTLTSTYWNIFNGGSEITGGEKGSNGLFSAFIKATEAVVKMDLNNSTRHLTDTIVFKNS